MDLLLPHITLSTSPTGTTIELVELDIHSPDFQAQLDTVPVEQRCLAFRSTEPESYERLRAVLDRMLQVPAAAYLLLTQAERSGDELAPLRLFRETDRPDLVTYARGPIGEWSRILGRCKGMYHIESSAFDDACHFPPEDYGIPRTFEVRELFGIAGNPLAGSLSPRMHNRAYRGLGLPYLYLPFHLESFSDFWKMITGPEWQRSVGLPLAGITTVSPYKEAAFHTIGHTESPALRQSRASNLALWKGDHWTAESSDGEGVLRILEKRLFAVEDRPVAILGCGGAGRTIAAHLSGRGARITLFNRSEERGRSAAAQLGLPYQPMAAFDPGAFDLIVHATPQGKHKTGIPFDPSRAHSQALLIDLVYSNGPTPLIREAVKFGLATGVGQEILIYQVRRQFQAMTGREMPLEWAMESAGIIGMNL